MYLLNKLAPLMLFLSEWLISNNVLIVKSDALNLNLLLRSATVTIPHYHNTFGLVKFAQSFWVILSCRWK